MRKQNATYVVLRFLSICFHVVVCCLLTFVPQLHPFNYNQYIFALGECGATHEDLIETFGLLQKNKVRH
jgi:hypothetical protein